MNEITKEEWLNRCSKRFQDVVEMDVGSANSYAESQLKYLKGDLTENPEDAADEEMSCWEID